MTGCQPEQIRHRLAISCASYRIQNASDPQNAPPQKKNPNSLPKPKNEKNTKIVQKSGKIRKLYKNRGFSYIVRALVSGEDSGCILGCILGIRGALYSARGAGDADFPTFATLRGKTFSVDDDMLNKSQTKTQTTPDTVFTREGRNSDRGLSFWEGKTQTMV